MNPNIVSFPVSAFPPLAVGFFGLGTGYLIYGPQELFGRPVRSRAVDLTTGLWGIWLPGFLQFFAGAYLFAGLVWFHSITAPPLYMAALAFTVYGVHWWAMGASRALGGDPRPNAFMAIGFTLVSALGVAVFSAAASRDVPVALVFAGLTCVYVAEFFASWFAAVPQAAAARSAGSAVETDRPVSSVLGSRANRALGFFHLLTGAWLIYLTWATALDFASGFSLWL
jgi:hypothetical protein